MPWLFSYGTLQEPRVQQDTFGRHLDGRSDVLAGFVRGQVPIDDPAQRAASGRTHYDNVVPTGRGADRVAGVALVVLSMPVEALAVPTALAGGVALGHRRGVSNYRDMVADVETALEGFLDGVERRR